MTEPRNLRVFLCHASQDKPIVRELYQRLNTEGWIDPWLDEEKLLPGQDWDMEIEKAVEAADAVIVVLSNNSVSKEGYIQKELRFVLEMAFEKPEGTIFIIPLRLNDVEPPRRLRSWHYTDYFPAEHKAASYERLIASLRLRAEKHGKVSTNVRQDKESKRTPSEKMIRLIKAIDVVCKSQSCHPILLQRRLMVGYLSALNLIDELEEMGVVSPEIIETSSADHKREVLLSLQALDTSKFSLKQAIESVLQEQRVSISILQQKMNIDYQRAVKLLNIMEKLGVVSSEKNDKNEAAVLIMQGVFQWN
jgi:hypothetical protein